MNVLYIGKALLSAMLCIYKFTRGITECIEFFSNCSWYSDIMQRAFEICSANMQWIWSFSLFCDGCGHGAEDRSKSPTCSNTACSKAVWPGLSLSTTLPYHVSFVLYYLLLSFLSFFGFFFPWYLPIKDLIIHIFAS